MLFLLFEEANKKRVREIEILRERERERLREREREKEREKIKVKTITRSTIACAACFRLAIDTSFPSMLCFCSYSSTYTWTRINEHQEKYKHLFPNFIKKITIKKTNLKLSKHHTLTGSFQLLQFSIKIKLF